ncbi:uncharacterized protein LOC111267675 [Varroa jacobsoni]|uniref:uncharacterized protein LOC111267675 n=1 Tax=Varroa jacobsoni TaxID=62625 RepID=UPI000BFA57A0|nr:uncharacterized protein LOC111267675 [Varroa jacobsoni]XP_022701800.1 uncharacterized protein LOC111267675 [Varroa jacobsoni]XP_022701802.1 uncharacterized protein LOC111267675 [Varroa jacobsoni]XP_022701803.1 uncharacterized protein LOC111267675 [Varroa jacobsoni]XP_022701804.1 uncharacterized protein LOC111267675 [Varroa jacobsoni]XP_022701805.1 uncharacterized protein LOC111267675 [Varroa jacobsoni]XP_022701806.1 uncharacterized protein LOC111267675 [Varroa jacobsoni]XP_022701807.1 unc
MASIKLPLSVAADFESLNDMCEKELDKIVPKQSAGVLRRALNPLFQEADKYFREGNEEKAYIVYMRYASLAMKEKEKDVEKIKKALGRLESLKTSLIDRYAQRNVEQSLDTLPSLPPLSALKTDMVNGSVYPLISPKSTAITGPPPAPSKLSQDSLPSVGFARTSVNGLMSGGISKSSTVPSGPPNTHFAVDPDQGVSSSKQPINGQQPDQKSVHFVTCGILHSLLKENKALVLDCRSAEAFKDSHISLSPNVINISKPYMGMTSFQISNQLTNEHRLLFERRKDFEKVVVVDWDGRGYMNPSAPAACIVEALWKWVLQNHSVTVYHLKDGYRLWVNFYPNDTTNSKPNENFNKGTDVPITGRLLTDSNLSSQSGGLKGRGEPVTAEQLRKLTWQPESFEQNVQVVNTPAVTPTVTPAGQTPAGANPRSTSTSSHNTASSGEGGATVRPVLSVPPFNDIGGAGDFRHDGPGASELSRVDRSSQDTVKQFTQSVNEKISAQVVVPKPRTKSEAGDSSTAPLPLPSSYSKPSIMRSRSLDNIYEENLRDDSFNRPLAYPAKAGATNCEQLHQLMNKRPSIDRSLKPSNSLDAATVHRSKDGTHPQQNAVGTLHAGSNNTTGVYYDGNNNNDHRIANGSFNLNNNNVFVSNSNEANQRQLITSTMVRPVAATRVTARPNIPPRTRRSQSPVQVYRYGLIDRTTGLRNLGNSCYMNSVLQALAHSTEFARYFVSRQHENHLNVNNKRGSGGKLPGLFSQLLSQLWSQNDTREALGQFRSLMGSLYPMYSTYDQQDSHEFLVNLLDRLHEDLNSAEKRNRPNSLSNPDAVVTFPMLAQELNKFFTAHSDMHMSCVTQNYEGILVSGLKCHTCDNDSYTFQVFNVLSVPIPNVSGLDIFHCFDEFFREEKVEDWHCPHCKAKRTASKHMRIARLPKHLIIHLVRFKNESWTAFSFSSYKKITNVVNFTIELDTRELAQYIYSKEVKLKSYTLYAIVNHYGTISSGHYYSDCRFLPNPQWYRYSDHQVTTLQSKVPDVGSAYMLFYSCVD